jgi:integrase
MTGKPKRRYVYGDTQKAVRDQVRELIGQVENGTLTEPTKIVFGEWLRTWIQDYMKPALRQTTWESYHTQVEKHLLPSLGHIPLRQVQTAHLQRLYNDKLQGGRADGKQGGLSPTSVRYIHAVAHGALEQALQEGLIVRNPAKAVRLPQKVKKQMRTLDGAGVSAFLSQARQTRYYAAFLLELATGLRRGELLGLRWQDIDFDAGTLRVEQQLVLTRDGIAFQAPKTPLSRRTIGIPETAVKQLRVHRRESAQEKLLLGDLYDDCGLVFAHEDGRPVNPRAFTRVFERVVRRAGLPRMAFHDLRHTFATLSLQEGVSVRTIQETLGHHAASFTMTTYAHVTDSMRREATDKIGRLLESYNAS